MKRQISIGAILWICILTGCLPVLACTNLLVTKGASADGSVTLVEEDIDMVVYKELCSMSGGEVVEVP